MPKEIGRIRPDTRWENRWDEMQRCCREGSKYLGRHHLPNGFAGNLPRHGRQSCHDSSTKRTSDTRFYAKVVPDTSEQPTYVMSMTSAGHSRSLYSLQSHCMKLLLSFQVLTRAGPPLWPQQPRRARRAGPHPCGKWCGAELNDHGGQEIWSHNEQPEMTQKWHIEMIN